MSDHEIIEITELVYKAGRVEVTLSNGHRIIGDEALSVTGDIRMDRTFEPPNMLDPNAFELVRPPIYTITLTTTFPGFTYITVPKPGAEPETLEATDLPNAIDEIRRRYRFLREPSDDDQGRGA